MPTRVTDEMYVARILKWLTLNISGSFKQKQLMNRENADLHLAHFKVRHNDNIIHVYINKLRHFHIQLWNVKDSTSYYEILVPGKNITSIPITDFKNAADDMRDYLYRDVVNTNLFALKKATPRNYN